ncbi:MAG: hypothetical protein KKF66_06405 [Actinobacteria bacterium]|nr:hypothetical protein [Actinomycetota bacterium]
MNRSLTRKQYASKAKLVAKIRQLYVDILKTPEEWTGFARRVKQENLRRPAFQEEFARAVPGWKEIV